MNSEPSQDGHFCFKNGAKDLISDDTKELLGFKETEDSTTKRQSEVMKPESNACTTKEHNFSLLMSAIDFITPKDHRLSSDESEEELMYKARTSTPKPEPSGNMDRFPSPEVNFVSENWSAWSLSRISMPSPKVFPSHAGDFIGDIQDGGPVSPGEIQDVPMVSEADQEGDLESGDETNAFQQINEVHDEPPKEPHPLLRFHSEQMVLQAISIWGMDETARWTNQEDYFVFNGIDIAGHLLEAAAAQMKSIGMRVTVNESALMAIATGLHLAIEYGDNPTIANRGIGPMVADILLHSETGTIMGFAVARLVPRPIINCSGCVQGSVTHLVTRGYAIDDNARRIIIEGVGTEIWKVNNLSPSGK